MINIMLRGQAVRKYYMIYLGFTEILVPNKSESSGIIWARSLWLSFYEGSKLFTPTIGIVRCVLFCSLENQAFELL